MESDEDNETEEEEENLTEEPEDYTNMRTTTRNRSVFLESSEDGEERRNTINKNNLSFSMIKNPEEAIVLLNCVSLALHSPNLLQTKPCYLFRERVASDLSYVE